MEGYWYYCQYFGGCVPRCTRFVVVAYTVYPLEWFLTPSHIEARKQRELCIVVTGLAPVMPPIQIATIPY